MIKKILVAFILTMLIVPAIFPVSSYNYIELEKQYNDDEIDWWPQFQHDPENTGYSSSNAPDTNNVLWTFSAKWDYGMFSAAVVDGKVYSGAVGVCTGYRKIANNISSKVFCLDAETGDLIWEYVSRYGFYATPAVVDDRVYICSGEEYYDTGDVFCLNADNGSLIWEYPNCGYVEGGPVVVDNKVYFSSKINGDIVDDFGMIYCLDAEFGKEIWNRTFCTPRGPVAVSNDKVFVGLTYWGDATTEMLFCLNASNGDTIWIWDEDNRDQIIGAPTVVNGRVYVATTGYGYITPEGSEYIPGSIYCLDAENGDVLWGPTVENAFYFSSPAIAYGNVYVGSGLYGSTGKFYCLNATDGEVIWERSRLFTYRGFYIASSGCYSPAIADGKVYFGTSSRFTANFFCLDAFSGETVWIYRRPAFWGSFFIPAVADSKVFVGFEGSFLPIQPSFFCFGE